MEIEQTSGYKEFQQQAQREMARSHALTTAPDYVSLSQYQQSQTILNAAGLGGLDPHGSLSPDAAQQVAVINERRFGSAQRGGGYTTVTDEQYPPGHPLRTRRVSYTY
ncbi:hypothetical protein RSP673_010470 [Ralstonia solanacearum P673]|uniref:hypothetical protein n=1 Tax=Ralstonia solanacearum TaxID=305 RepID=UPI000452D7CC|nr:hypothetical protein [Ralstonia solanacearum]EUJ15023.1 hypothetical protein RSP673_07665 [Ralstonia solanacearum P673]MCL9849235.1 hypothetical protein [Ralstonia solanacearum]MCL9854823.1 hypothetical protein [Ralstonia solanacearum]MCL9861817.1 hypothetical protein [Ralstonia solanacearum]MCL9864493.1 hypothetical protein [Ralstonia solanacearum]